MFPVFDTSQLRLRPLADRESDLSLSEILPLKRTAETLEELRVIAERMTQAKQRGSEIIFMMGAHVLRSGVQRYIIDLMERGYISCIACNGAGIIHDFEFSFVGQTTESVTKYIQNGQFGLWKETGRINDIVTEAAENGLGLGEAIGKVIHEGRFPHKEISIFAAGYRLKIPVTVHVGIGYDIVHEHPNCDGAAWGSTSYLDFLRFVKVLENLEGGVLMNFGSAVMAPEVYLKALAMVRNVAQRENRVIKNFTTLVCDIQELPQKYQQEAPRSSAGYYFRPWKTMLVRTVADGGDGFYVKAPHKQSVPELWTHINEAEEAV